MSGSAERVSRDAGGGKRSAGADRAVTGRAVAGRAVAGAAVLALAIGVGSGAGAVLTEWLGLTGFGARLLPAVLCSAIAVPLVLALRVRWARRSLVGIGLTGVRESTRAFLLGVAVTMGAATVVLGISTAAGWVRWGPVDLAGLLVFLLGNGIVAVLLEALPEELALRGYAWTTLRERYRAVVATVGTTALFLVVPGVSLVVQAAVVTALGGTPFPVGIAPSGEDPISYLVLLTAFGLTLVAARTATRSASLWTCIGTHLAFLTVNRIILAGQRLETGWSAEFTTPYAMLLIPAYLAVAALTYLTIARLRRRRRSATP